MNPLALVLAAAAGFAAGSVPVAYLIVKRRRGLDLHRTGSTNVGASNAYASTGSRRIGAAVLLLDAAKGMAAVLGGALLAGAAGWALMPGDAWYRAPECVALLAAVLAHNYNVPLTLTTGRLSGGKGFATAAGGLLLVMPWLVPIWLGLMWVGMRAFTAWRGVRDVIPGNVLATALIPAVAWALYGPLGGVTLAAFAALTLPKHRAQLRALLRAPRLVHPRAGGAAGAGEGAAPDGGRIGQSRREAV